MSGSEQAAHFGVPAVADKPKGPNDIYFINARVKNKARAGSGGVLTPVGDILCNSMSHVLKKLYEFSETLDDVNKEKLKAILQKAEEMPGDVICASRAGITPPRKR